MVKRLYSSNTWGYNQLGDSLTLLDVAGHIRDVGFDGFDFLYGVGAYPKISSDIKLNQIVDLKQVIEEKGGIISAVVLVSFDLNKVDDCQRQLEDGAILANALGTRRLNLLPRKKSISKAEAFKRLEYVWIKKGEEILRSGFKVSAENHVSAHDENSDEFLIRTSHDFLKLEKILGGQVRIKFDPAWLMMANEDPLKAFEQCLPFIDLLDVKDFKSGLFVTPGTGLIDFNRLAHMMKAVGKNFDICVEVEEHLYEKPPLKNIEKIDFLHKSALDFYKSIFERQEN